LLTIPEAHGAIERSRRKFFLLLHLASGPAHSKVGSESTNQVASESTACASRGGLPSSDMRCTKKQCTGDLSWVRLCGTEATDKTLPKCADMTHLSFLHALLAPCLSSFMRASCVCAARAHGCAGYRRGPHGICNARSDADFVNLVARCAGDDDRAPMVVVE
jgi:hypothetical protein